MGDQAIVQKEEDSGLWDRVKSKFSSKPKNIKAPPKNCNCYVLITCTEPSKEGDMEVEMTYEGDESLVSYLVENAQVFFKKESQ